MAGFHVLVADLSKADLYTLPSRRGGLSKTKGFVNTAARRPERALGSGAPGRVMSSGGVRHAFEARSTMKQHVEEQFVRRVTASVDKALAAEPSSRLILVAAPRLLGLYRRFLPEAVLGRLTIEIRHDLGKTPFAELQERVRAALAVPLPIAPTTARAIARRRKHPAGR